MSHVRGAPCHPQTQGKIERWHQTLKNRILLENYFLPGDLEAQIDAFVGHYNGSRTSYCKLEEERPALPREPKQRDVRRRRSRQGSRHLQTRRNDPPGLALGT
jgi:putative transposase